MSIAIVVSASACSEAETPEANFDGGGRPDGGFTPFDSGPDNGARDQSCLRGRCDSSDLVCVSTSQGDAGVVDFCRLRCTLGDNSDPCGDASSCGRLTDNSGACLPAGKKDEPCPCDEGFTCVILDTDAGQTTICKSSCDTDIDAGPDAGIDSQCVGSEQCVRLNMGNGAGACVD